MMDDKGLSLGSGSYVIDGSKADLRRDFSTEGWQFFAFVFAAFTTLAFALLDELLRPSSGFWIWGGGYLSPRAVSVMLKVLVFAILGYLMLFCAPMKEFIIRVLPYIKRGKSR